MKNLYLLAFLLISSIGYSQMVKILPPNDAAGDRIKFGSSISIDGDLLAIGCPDEDVSGDDNLGYVYVYQRQGADWNVLQKIASPPNDPYEQFGANVALNGDLLAIASYNALTGGIIYIYKRSGNTFSKVAELTEASNLGFGQGLAWYDNQLIVGTTGYDNNKGAIFIFRESNNNNYNRIKRITNPTGSANGYFGFPITVNGNGFITGAPTNTTMLEGEAFYFTWNGSDWVQSDVLMASDATLFANFGSGVGLSGSDAIIGAKNKEEGAIGAGVAYHFTLSNGTWTEQGKLQGSEIDQGDNFGESVILIGDDLFVSAPIDRIGVDNVGRIYHFQKNGSNWVEQAIIAPADASNFKGFGRLMDLSDGHLAIAASGDNERGQFMGAVYVMPVDVSSTTKAAEYAQDLYLYPNPTQDRLNVKWNAPHGHGAATMLAKVYNNLGVQVAEKEVSIAGDFLNVSSLPQGVYHLELNHEGISFGKTFMKQ